jgi:hypothetical protein
VGVPYRSGTRWRRLLTTSRRDDRRSRAMKERLRAIVPIAILMAIALVEVAARRW